MLDTENLIAHNDNVIHESMFDSHVLLRMYSIGTLFDRWNVDALNATHKVESTTSTCKYCMIIIVVDDLSCGFGYRLLQCRR